MLSQELQPGAPQTTWVQSQTTYVGLAEEDGVWLPRVRKQKIWVEGVSYELQEIYGMEHAAGASKAKTVRPAASCRARICRASVPFGAAVSTSCTKIEDAFHFMTYVLGSASLVMRWLLYQQGQGCAYMPRTGLLQAGRCTLLKAHELSTSSSPARSLCALSRFCWRLLLAIQVCALHPHAPVDASFAAGMVSSRHGQLKLENHCRERAAEVALCLPAWQRPRTPSHPSDAICQQGEESAEDAEERLCVICLVNNRDTTVLPCRHMCMCHECAQVCSRPPLWAPLALGDKNPGAERSVAPAGQACMQAWQAGLTWHSR